MSISLCIEILLCVLLVATLGFCLILERKLSAMRKGQDGLKALIAELNGAIGAAGTSMRLLKSAATGAVEELDQKVGAARAAIDELSVLTASGDRIAARIERSLEVQPRPQTSVLPAAADRLAGVRPRIVRPKMPLDQVMEGVR
ncbi:MAG: hypothetical protein KGO02_10150 [Alphaproteobacteria bacterium]|nr:hypothetical protein [Alphaproteobacteria bacterium]